MAAKKRVRKKPAGVVEAPDPRSPIKPTPAATKKATDDVRAILERLPPPPEPSPGDLVGAMLHAIFSDGVACGYGQEAVRRIDANFVDRNEFRVTEGYEVVDLLGDLEIPQLYERCSAAREAVAGIYNDQNRVVLDFLREASVTDRNQFFTRVPAIAPPVVWFLNTLLSLEEVVFSPRSTQRAQQRLGLDPKAPHIDKMVADLREMLQPYGHLPLRVGPDREDGAVLLDPPLSPACLLMRLAARRGSK